MSLQWRASLRALLIQKSIKLCMFRIRKFAQFESFVNSEEYQTFRPTRTSLVWFENFVNSEEYQTTGREADAELQFESFVNSKVV